MSIRLIRVCYGKKETPEELREFVLYGTNGPVGTIKEWCERFGKQNIEIIKEV